MGARRSTGLPFARADAVAGFRFEQGFPQDLLNLAPPLRLRRRNPRVLPQLHDSRTSVRQAAASLRRKGARCRPWRLRLDRGACSG